MPQTSPTDLLAARVAAGLITEAQACVLRSATRRFIEQNGPATEKKRLNDAMWANRPLTLEERVADELDSFYSNYSGHIEITPISDGHLETDTQASIPLIAQPDPAASRRLPGGSPRAAGGEGGAGVPTDDPFGCTIDPDTGEVVFDVDSQGENETGTPIASHVRVPRLILESKVGSAKSEKTDASETASDSDLDDITQTVEERCDRFAPARKRTTEMVAFLENLGGTFDPATGCDPADIAQRMRDCGNWLVFHEYQQLGLNRLHAARFCHKHLLCPFCAIRRGAKMNRAYAPLIATLVRDRGYTAYLGTWTIKNGADLDERFTHLVTSWRAALQRRNWRIYYEQGKRQKFISPNQLARCPGLTYSVEVKRGRNSGLWHPHLHAVLLANGPLDQQAARDEWQSITGDSHEVDIRPFHCMDALTAAETPDDVVGLLSGDLVEVLKYAVKFSSMSLEDTWEAYRLLRGRRLIGKVGDLRGLEVPKELIDAPMELGDVPFVEAVATYVAETEMYSIERTV